MNFKIGDIVKLDIDNELGIIININPSIQLWSMKSVFVCWINDFNFTWTSPSYLILLKK